MEEAGNQKNDRHFVEAMEKKNTRNVREENICLNGQNNDTWYWTCTSWIAAAWVMWAQNKKEVLESCKSLTTTTNF